MTVDSRPGAGTTVAESIPLTALSSSWPTVAADLSAAPRSGDEDDRDLLDFDRLAILRRALEHLDHATLGLRNRVRDRG
jgi:hypothetical protein